MLGVAERNRRRRTACSLAPRDPGPIEADHHAEWTRVGDKLATPAALLGRAVPGNIQSIERAAAILRLLSGRSRRLGVVDLSGELGLPKGTVHGLLRTLQHVGFVEQDAATGKYQLGAALLHMGSSYLDGNELRTRALNWSDSLAGRAGEAVRIGTLHDSQVLIVHHVFRPDDSLQTLDVGSLLPAHATALGKVLLAHHPYVADELVKQGLASFTGATICNRERLDRELQRIRDRGWASEIGELTPVQVSLAAPITDRTGLTVGAMGIFGPAERLLAARQPRGELVAYVREAAQAVSRELGAIPW
jgi:DNA-binding IclR family transcriptional regulator